MSMSQKALLAILFAMIGLNTWSLYTVRALHADEYLRAPEIHSHELSMLGRLKLVDGNRSIDPEKSGTRISLLYIFSPYDCPQSIDELGELESLQREQPSLDIKAIALYESADEVEQTRQKFRLTFPIASDPKATAKELLRPPQTPWKVLMESSNQHVLLQDGPSITTEEKKAFHNRVVYLLRAFQHDHPAS